MNELLLNDQRKLFGFIDCTSLSICQSFATKLQEQGIRADVKEKGGRAIYGNRMGELLATHRVVFIAPSIKEMHKIMIDLKELKEVMFSIMQDEKPRIRFIDNTK